MGKGGEKGEEECKPQVRFFTWEEIQKHNLRTDRWLVIERKVYNVTQWAHRHPGGQRVIGHCAGEDATVRDGAAPGSGTFPRARARTSPRTPAIPACAAPPPLGNIWRSGRERLRCGALSAFVRCRELGTRGPRVSPSSVRGFGRAGEHA